MTDEIKKLKSEITKWKMKYLDINAKLNWKDECHKIVKENIFKELEEKFLVDIKRKIYFRVKNKWLK